MTEKITSTTIEAAEQTAKIPPDGGEPENLVVHLIAEHPDLQRTW